MRDFASQPVRPLGFSAALGAATLAIGVAAAAQSAGAACSGACLASRDVCAAIVAALKPKIETLKPQIEQQKKRLDAELARQDEEQRQRSQWWNILNNLAEDVQGYRPPRYLADLNQNIGAEECYQGIFDDCQGEIARIAALAGPSPPSPDRGAADYRAAYDAFATRLAAQAQQTGDEHWQMAQQRQRMFDNSVHDYRLATEANQFIGFSEACRHAAGDILALRFGEATTTKSNVSDACRALLEKQPYFCVTPPMTGDDSQYRRDAERCCIAK